jgi:antitoxin (DNA-binding transcriptional repressor) of toxin-antitoxin stability system
MCYMAATKAARTIPPARRPGARPRVGVRELRQNLSVYLERIGAGERFDVTDRGRVVAMLIPIPPAATLVERLVAEGRAIPATRDGRLLPPLRGKIPADLGKRLQQALQESREDRL